MHAHNGLDLSSSIMSCMSRLYTCTYLLQEAISNLRVPETMIQCQRNLGS